MLQKSIRNTIFMLIILAMYSMIANYTIKGYGTMYSLVVNPLFWIVFVIFAKFFTAPSSENVKIRSKVTEYALIASLVNIGIFILSELFLEIGKNPYSTTPIGIIINGFVYILPIIAKEYIRFKLINNVYEKDKSFIALLVTCVFVFIDIGTFDELVGKAWLKFLIATLLPVVLENVLCTYIAMNKSYRPAIVYRTITTSFWFISPILPKISWIMSTFVEVSVSAVLFAYVHYLKVRENLRKEKKQVETTSNPKSLIPLVVSIVIMLWFGIGIFPIRPVAIATGSMENTLMVGDVAILKKCTSDEIEVGDIIQYQKDDFTVIHRVISKYYEDGKCYLITKGDNNQSADFNPVAEEQIIAKQLFSIRYLGLPAVWLNNSGIIKGPDTSSIEKGV